MTKILHNISGFPEFLPNEQILFNKVVEIIKTTFELYGFVPLDTPAVERVSVLLSKGNDTEIYGIHRLSQSFDGNTEMALRFDLTVPLARYVAQHHSELTFPYRRYHIAPVWRGERSQHGRYKQFYQCDIDIIGNNVLDIMHDAEILSVMHDVFVSIGIEHHKTIINNRSLLIGLMKIFDIADEFVVSAIRTIDKIRKVGIDGVKDDLLSYGIKQECIDIISSMLEMNISNQDWLIFLRNLPRSDELSHGLSELSQILDLLVSFGIPDTSIVLDPLLARGLNYYTGTIFESVLTDSSQIGSFCGGGRYDNLVDSLGGKKMPGVGCSVGLSRLMPKLLEIHGAKKRTVADILITTQNRNIMPYYINIAKILRLNNINAELYLENKSLADQMQYANKTNVMLVIIANTDNANEDTLVIRRMNDGEQFIVHTKDLLSKIKEILG